MSWKSTSSLQNSGVLNAASGGSAPPRRLRIEQVQPAFLAGGRHQLASLVVEDRRRVVRIEIALAQPVPVGRRVVVLQFQLPLPRCARRRRCWRSAADRWSDRRCRRRSWSTPCRSSPSPRRAGPRRRRCRRCKFITLCCGIVERAPPRSMSPAYVVCHPEHVADEIQRPALAGVEHVRRLQIGSPSAALRMCSMPSPVTK